MKGLVGSAVSFHPNFFCHSVALDALDRRQESPCWVFEVDQLVFDIAVGILHPSYRQFGQAMLCHEGQPVLTVW